MRRDVGFRLFLRSARRVLADRMGADAAAEVLQRTRQEYDDVRGLVPDIGGTRNVFQPVMTINGWIVALHRAMQERGAAAADTIRVCHLVFDGWIRTIPAPMRGLLGRVLLSLPVQRYFERQAARSRERRYAADFVWRVTHGADGEVSFVFDECAVNKWYDTHGLLDLKPFCNFADVTYSRLLGMGVDAHETIGLGCRQCALRFKPGRDTAVPPSLRDVVVDA